MHLVVESVYNIPVVRAGAAGSAGPLRDGVGCRQSAANKGEPCEKSLETNHGEMPRREKNADKTRNE